MTSQSKSKELHDLLRNGADVATTVYEFGKASIQRSSKDDLTILTVTGVFTRALAKEIERLGLQTRGNLGLEFKDALPGPGGKKFDTNILGLLNTLKERFEQRGWIFALCSPPAELRDVLTLTGTIGKYRIIGSSRSPAGSTGVPAPQAGIHSREPLVSPEDEQVHKRIINLNQSLKRTAILEKGLDSAQKCVLRFLPRETPEVPGYAFAFSYKSSEKVGGDFFDFIPLGDDAIGIVLGDVSGHGLDAAILMSLSKKVLSLRAREFGPSSPKEVLCKANEDLAPDFNKYSFVTVLYGILQPSTGRFHFCRAGHEAPIVFTPGLRGLAIKTNGMPLGAASSRLFSSVLEEKTVKVPPGAYLLLCTDGLAESKDERETIFSRQRLLYAVKDIRKSMTCCEALDHVLRTVEDFSGDHCQEDDITTILLYRIETER